MDYQKFAIFVLLLVIANFLTTWVNQMIPSQSGILGWAMGILIPAVILWLILRQWGGDAGIQVRE